MKKYYIVILVLLILFFGFWFFKSGNVSNPEETPITHEPDTTGLPKAYESSLYKFKINLPEDFIVDEDYVYESTPSRSFPGVKFSIPERLYKGTNLSSDSYISVEKLSYDALACVAGSFLDSSESQGLTQVNGLDFTSAYSIGAGAGNRYEETVYATQVTDGCIAIRYFMHYGVLENYEEGAVTDFDKSQLISIFDSIRKTLIVSK